MFLCVIGHENVFFKLKYYYVYFINYFPIFKNFLSLKIIIHLSLYHNNNKTEIRLREIYKNIKI